MIWNKAKHTTSAHWNYSHRSVCDLPFISVSFFSHWEFFRYFFVKKKKIIQMKIIFARERSIHTALLPSSVLYPLNWMEMVVIISPESKQYSGNRRNELSPNGSLVSIIIIVISWYELCSKRMAYFWWDSESNALTIALSMVSH